MMTNSTCAWNIAASASRGVPACAADPGRPAQRFAHPAHHVASRWRPWSGNAWTPPRLGDAIALGDVAGGDQRRAGCAGRLQGGRHDLAWRCLRWEAGLHGLTGKSSITCQCTPKSRYHAPYAWPDAVHTMPSARNDSHTTACPSTWRWRSDHGGLKAEGFGVLSDTDVQRDEGETRREMQSHRILGACNPPLAHIEWRCRPKPDIGLLLPCNVIV